MGASLPAGGRRDRTARSDVHPVHRFHSWQVWPGSYDNPPADGTFPCPPIDRPRFDRSTPIAGIGSCFLREVKDRLISVGSRFLVEESEKKASRHASAAWERLYNLFSVRQVLEYSLADRVPAPRWWVAPVSGKIQDPYRRIVLYDTEAEAEADFADHRRRACRVLTEARTLVLTLDYVEVFEDRRTGAVVCLPSGPYVNEGGDLGSYRFRVSRYAENLACLERIHGLLRAHNPECHLVLMVSPHGQWVTFRDDADVFSASENSKATLRAVADEFVATHTGVSYFPAYEMALLYRQTLGLPVFATGRENFHVNTDVLDYIMEQFFLWYGLAQR